MNPDKVGEIPSSSGTIIFNLFGFGYAGQAQRMTEQLLAELRG